MTRTRLFDAAVAIVGESGYAATSVALITARAEVAQGTFYNYFESRQDLLDQLLPAISDGMHDLVRKRVLAAADDALARERARISAFFEFLEEAPHLFKILSEGPVQAPLGFARHMEKQTASYRRALAYELRRGNLVITSADELEVVAQMLLSSREYLSARFCFVDGRFVRPPAFVVDTYMKMVAGTVFKT
ncbi:MAG: TetR/AcrR family transcriptional regulator [Rhizobiaceae bacterium]|nr:TetR/AcrR family transcriptional regulator [Rhizobiaceae bacterium]